MPLETPVFNKRNLVMMSQSELVKRLDPNGKIAQIAEVLDETNEMLWDMTFKESNLDKGYMTTIRTGLPTAYWRQINMGVPPSKSQAAQVTEASGMMEAQSRVDPKLLEYNNNTAAFRASEDRAFLEAMNQTMQYQVIYGDATKTKEGFNGLTCRYNTLDPKKAQSAKNVIDAGGTGDNLTSIWIVAWGDRVFGFYPKGTTVGLKTSDKGLVLVPDENGNLMENYVTIYDWDMGLCVTDWRYCARVCNINVDDLMNGRGCGTADVRTAGSNNLILMVQRALDLIPRGGANKIAIYMNGDVFSGLNTLSARADQNVIQLESGLNRHGEYFHWRTFLGYPMRRVDQIQIGEKQVE